ncbi:SH3 domain-binding protein 5 homolog [Lutzomyia longipalpis]|uniref:Putative btk-associated sh3-domain binding protein sab n=1 Tax=Lutzomyia longipalpis TaxID=7200 RepID=A0A7G3ACS2_LUTLO|nr:SH3 domain-binding protein 5 homolog [Lutzomyia longipalpis]
MDNDADLDPRIQIELENLNTATDEINKLEIELEEANTTFRILLNESTRRLKLLSKKLGGCIEKARPYYDALENARIAQIECQKAAVKFQRANEIHAAAKETVALAEQRFMSNSHEWQFDNAWQEMLNHATIKVMDADNQKAESNAEHQRKAIIFNAAEQKVQQLEERLKRNIHKSRPYFEEKQICKDQLETQKGRIQELQSLVQVAKASYSNALRNLETISEEIHKQRGELSCAAPPGPREPGVGAELNVTEMTKSKTSSTAAGIVLNSPVLALPDYTSELERCAIQSTGTSVATSSAVSEKGDDSDVDDADLDLEELRQRVKVLAIRPVEGGDGQQEQDVWESELNATVDKLDHLMMIRECGGMPYMPSGSFPATPRKTSPSPIKQLQKAPPPPTVNTSLKELSVAQLLPAMVSPHGATSQRSSGVVTNEGRVEHKRKLSV